MAIFDDTKNWSEKLSIYPHGYRLSEGQPILDKAEAKSIKLIEEEPLRNECSHFLEVVNGQVQPLTDGQEGNRVLNVLTASSKSLKLNKQVTL
jgi:UDP-2-acetamido-3-amino-2,3-dideoxy-glucuronate N-acetyltransferase